VVVEASGAAPIRVGVLNDLADAPSDDITSAGGLEQYLQLAIDEVRATGRLDRDVELVTAYGLGLPRGTAAAVEHAYAELVAHDVLLIVGPAIGDNALVATPLADAARVPTIHWAGTGKARSEWMFHLQVGSHEDEATVLARHLVATGARSVGLVFDRSPIGKRYAAYFETECEILGLDITARRSVSPVVTDASAEVHTVMATAPDALVYLGLGLSGRAVAVARRDAGWDAPALMNSAGMFGHSPAVGADLDGWIYVDMFSDTNTTLAALRERLGPDHAPEKTGATPVYGYDLGQLVAEGLARAPELTRAGVRDGLELVKWVPAVEGHEGTMLSFGTQDRGALHGRYLVLRRWEQGRSLEVT
jgi:ABC-type branched-subunit amino acid transport system substrate-binding protein